MPQDYPSAKMSAQPVKVEIRSLEWFEERIGETIRRGGRKVLIGNEHWARHLFQTQHKDLPITEDVIE